MDTKKQPAQLEYRLRWADGSGVRETIKADGLERAVMEAKSRINTTTYDVESTIWISVHIDALGAEGDWDHVETVTVGLDPDEPECTEAEHDWQSPIEIVGGLKENPGVWGNGGGVIITEVCMHCGCERVTDTWAQNSETGKQGLKSVSYEVSKYADEIAAMCAEESAVEGPDGEVEWSVYSEETDTDHAIEIGSDESCRHWTRINGVINGPYALREFAVESIGGES